MPTQYQFLEKIAFTLVVMAAAMCSAFIAYESSPELRTDLQVGEQLMLQSTQYSYACPTIAADPCAQFQTH